MLETNLMDSGPERKNRVWCLTAMEYNELIDCWLLYNAWVYASYLSNKKNFTNIPSSSSCLLEICWQVPTSCPPKTLLFILIHCRCLFTLRPLSLFLFIMDISLFAVKGSRPPHQFSSPFFIVLRCHSPSPSYFFTVRLLHCQIASLLIILHSFLYSLRPMLFPYVSSSCRRSMLHDS